MFKKMKRVALATSPAYSGGVGEDAKTRLKHQTLLQDYEDLLKEANDMRNKLDIAKQKKLILLAEVRFLRRRHRYLLKTNSLNHPQEHGIDIENQSKLRTKERVLHKRETTQFKLPPLPDLKHKGKVYTGKEGAMKNMTPSLDLNRKGTSRSGKEAARKGPAQASDLNYRKRISYVKEAAVQNVEIAINLNQNEKLQSGNDNGLATRMPLFDLNQDTGLGGKEAALPTRAPIFDLNEISMEEEEVQNNYERPKLEETKKGLIRAGNEEQPTDMMLSVCRNAGEGSSRMGKRKISWQDPVALRV